MKKQFLLLTLLVGGITSLNAAEGNRGVVESYRRSNEVTRNQFSTIRNQEKLLEEAKIQLTRINDICRTESGVTDRDIDSVLADSISQRNYLNRLESAYHIVDIIQNDIIKIIEMRNEEAAVFNTKYGTLLAELAEQNKKIESFICTNYPKLKACFSNIETQLDIRLAKIEYERTLIWKSYHHNYDAIKSNLAVFEFLNSLDEELFKLESLKYKIRAILPPNSYPILDPELQRI